MKTIAVDVDDVLAASAEGFVKFSNDRWGTKLEPGDYDEHWAQMWQLSQDETMARRETILGEKLFMSYRFFDDAKPVLQELAKRYKLVIISSRSREVQKDTLEWIAKEYQDLFSEIHFADIWNNKQLSIDHKVKLTKAEICGQVGADYLIDDQPKHCLAVAEAGITTLLFGDYKWSRAVKLKPNMVRVQDWQAVKEYFDGQP